MPPAFTPDPFLNPTPIYLRRKSAPEVRQHRDVLQMVAQQKSGLLMGGVTPEVVRENIMASIQDLVMATQHYPEALEALIFGLDIGFQYTAEDPTPMPEYDWRGHAPVARWIHQISSRLPILLFFLADNDLRFYALAGDLLADEAIPFSDAPEEEVPFPVPKGHRAFTFPPPVAEELAERLYIASYLMHIFCHGTGVDPEPYIHALLAEYYFTGLNYEDIRERYENSIRNGSFRWTLTTVDPTKGQ